MLILAGPFYKRFVVKKSLTILFFVFYRMVSAQDIMNELTVDRPGIAETPYTVSPGMYQFEFGLDYYQRYNGKIFYLPVGLFRTGISKRTELRLSTRQVKDKTDSRVLNGMAPLSVGFKTHLVKQRHRRPEIDILADVVIPTSSSPLQPKHAGPEVLLLFQNDFYPNMAINYNVGLLWDVNLEENVFTSSVCFNFLPFKTFDLFVEYFSFVPKNQWPGEQGVDGGITFLVHPFVQLDLSAGYSRITQEDNFFVSSGLSFRLHRKKKSALLVD